MPKSGQAWNVEFLRTSPILAPFAPLLDNWTVRSTWPTLEEYTEFADAQRRTRAPDARGIRFARAEPKRTRSRRDTALDPGRLYDGRIALHGEVPCLDQSYHDLFNVLVWAAFPRAKRALHARQFRALQGWLPAAASRLPNRRTREQDALTVFDEGGSVLVTTRSLEIDAEPKRLEAGAACILFGHALMEHVAYGRSAVRSAAVVVSLDGELPSGGALFDHVDEHVTQRLLDASQFTAPGTDAVVEIDEQGGLWLSR